MLRLKESVFFPPSLVKIAFFFFNIISPLIQALQELLLQRREELIAAKVCAETQQSEADLLREELQIQQEQNAQIVLEMQQLQ